MVDRNFQILSKVLMTLKKYKFELNYAKCQFSKQRIKVLGYVILIDGITLSPRHTNDVKNFRSPSNVHEVQRFLGLASYFQKLKGK